MVNRFILHRRRKLKQIVPDIAFPHTPFFGNAVNGQAPDVYRGVYGCTPYNRPYRPKFSSSTIAVNYVPSGLLLLNSSAKTINNTAPYSFNIPGYTHPSQTSSIASDNCSITLPIPTTFFKYLYYHSPPGAIAQYNAAQITLAELNESYPQFGNTSNPVKFDKALFHISSSPYSPVLTTYPNINHYLITDGCFYYSVTSNTFDVSSPTPVFSGEGFINFSFPPEEAPFGYIYKIKSIAQGQKADGTNQFAFLVQFLAFSQIPYKYIPANPILGVVNFQTPAPVFQKEFLLYQENVNSGLMPGLDSSQPWKTFETRSSGFNLTYTDWKATSGWQSCLTHNYLVVRPTPTTLTGYSLEDGSIKQLGPYPSNILYFEGSQQAGTFGQEIYVAYIAAGGSNGTLKIDILDNDLNIKKTYTSPINADIGDNGFQIAHGTLLSLNNQLFLYTFYTDGSTIKDICLIKFDIKGDELIQSSMRLRSRLPNLQNPPNYDVNQTLFGSASGNSNFFVWCTGKDELLVKFGNPTPATAIYFP